MLVLLSNIFTQSYKILSVVTPMINYLPQYFLMEKQRSVGSFASQICYLLMTSSMLRILFWFHETFEVCLLLQSVVVFGLQIFLLYKYIDVSRNDENTSQISEPQKMPKIHVFRSAVFILARVLTPLVVSYAVFVTIFVWSNNYYMAQTTGAVACTLEVILPLPQVIKNWQLGSVKGLR